MKIFISYRRQDSEWIALSLYNELVKHFPKEEVFKDFNTIKPGEDFTKAIENNLRSCDVLLVVIGKEWLHCKDEEGNARIFKEHDFVRLEIEVAMKLGKKIIPILVEDVKMPSMEELPPTIADLHKLQLVRLGNTSFEMDIFNLVNSFYQISGKKNPYYDLVKNIATGRVKEEELIKPENNSVYAIGCFALGMLIVLGWSEEVFPFIVGLIVAGAGVYAYFLSRRVKPLWLDQQFEQARAKSKRTKMISLIVPGSSMVVLIIFSLVWSLKFLASDEYSKLKPLINPEMQTTYDATTNNNPTKSTQSANTGDANYQQQSNPSAVSYPAANQTNAIYIVSETTYIFNEPNVQNVTLNYVYGGTEFYALDFRNGFVLGDFYAADGTAYRGWISAEHTYSKE